MLDPLNLPLPGREGEEVELLKSYPANPKRLTSRSRERVRAIDVAYEADARVQDLLALLAQRRTRTAAQTPLPERSAQLVTILAAHQGEIDEELSALSRDWPLHRMPAVDRAILRLGSAEILHDTPLEGLGAVVGEYVTIARELSTEDSPKFVNALLQRIAEIRELQG
ncbi:transcription antitermination factor NusB [Brachybacterium sp. JHP9]|uniref:Transcription antitermination protein NusB n=1 Tax=Brachybacterium equifaecis TaxID=2910770 RepID=A0ABT0R1T7_9MICO|nr:transcription antitermination factor NusB [Brachybacterium equifaecis]